MKIASKRQVTVPQRLLDILGAREGDEIQVETLGNDVVSVHGCRSVPTHLLPDDLKRKMNERSESALSKLKPESARDILRQVRERSVAASYSSTRRKAGSAG